ncbi:hypothetical protein LZ32DRAFT_116454 [Colletotrichum eremochloae]|nr:hypothetical protein LZ32DRAFT_116454 [Colletotrichum eremochloae]
MMTAIPASPCLRPWPWIQSISWILLLRAVLCTSVRSHQDSPSLLRVPPFLLPHLLQQRRRTAGRPVRARGSRVGVPSTAAVRFARHVLQLRGRAEAHDDERDVPARIEAFWHLSHRLERLWDHWVCLAERWVWHVGPDGI